MQAALAHVEHVNLTLTSLHYQQRALRISSSALDHHVLATSDGFETLAAIAERELEKQAKLLSGLDADLEIASRVKVHKEFLSASMRSAMEAGGKARTLGDYVSRVKMQQVASSCLKTHEELKTRFEDVQEAMARLSRGGDEVRHAVGNNSSIDDGEGCARRAQELWERLSTLNTTVERPGVVPEKALQEFRQLDDALRIEVERVTDVKNAYTEQCIYTIRRISELNTDLVTIPSAMTSLQTSFRAKTSFAHIARLHSMLYAYGATVVEVVRRKEFARFFYQRAQNILEVMAKLSSNERKRRQAYKNEVQGELPFDVKAMDDVVPNIDFSPSGSNDSQYSLERMDIDVLSTSRLLSHRRRTTEDEQAYVGLQQQLQELQQQKAEGDAAERQSKAALEAEIAALRDSLQMSETARGQLERDVHATRAQLESEATSRRILDDRNSEMSKEADAKREALARALSEATEQTRTAELLRQQLAQVRSEFEAVKELETRNADKVTLLLEEQAKTLHRLEEARARGEDLEAQIHTARGESDDVKRALVEAGKEKDRLLRAQASEHDRLLRDHIAEADGDRAVLERQFSELRAAVEDSERQLKDARAQAEMANADAVGLREELQRVEHELRDTRRDERTVREDLRAGRASQASFEHKLEQSERLLAQMLDVALAFRDAHVKALSNVQVMVTHPGSRAVGAANGDSGLSSSRHAIVAHSGEPAPIDPSDPAAALEALRGFDHDHFLEAIGKAGSTIRKWQKQCKDYRERAKGKISFRNFAKGDLALFLPTRNSISKPWAAFNVSFPHYFLQATGHLAEQLKTREWIVARITSITERVVDSKDPATNPYGLGDGVKYYMLEVEDWTQPSYPSKRRESSKKLPLIDPPSQPMTEPLPVSEAIPIPAAPPEPEVEESFSATRPPTSSLFPRNRSASSPTAGPSSLSRLLAQAGPSEPLGSSLGFGLASADGKTSSDETPPLSHPRVASPTIAASPPDHDDHSPEASRSVSPNLPVSPPVAAPSQPRAQSPVPPPSPTRHSKSPTSPGVGPHPVNNHFPSQPSPLRSTSRASRGSSSSRFSRAIPTKAVPTTAITEQAVSTLSTTPSSASGSTTSDHTLGVRPIPLALSNGKSTSTIPSPQGSPTLGMTSVLTQSHRRRTTSYHLPNPRGSTVGLSSPTAIAAPSSPLAGAGIGATASSRLASLASSWGVSFGRRRKSELLDEQAANGSGRAPGGSSPIPESPTQGSD
uniref:Autophagy-related protein 11 n=1 Tax=Ganoderma boninense TaxID=34458 RepID=A0A5K1JWA0_9APHY|nr:Autophagy-related protein 11 [Ganoderma boninense]